MNKKVNYIICALEILEEIGACSVTSLEYWHSKDSNIIPYIWFDCENFIKLFDVEDTKIGVAEIETPFILVTAEYKGILFKTLMNDKEYDCFANKGKENEQ